MERGEGRAYIIREKEREKTFFFFPLCCMRMYQRLNKAQPIYLPRKGKRKGNDGSSDTRKLLLLQDITLGKSGTVNEKRNTTGSSSEISVLVLQRPFSLLSLFPPLPKITGTRGWALEKWRGGGRAIKAQ